MLLSNKNKGVSNKLGLCARTEANSSEFYDGEIHYRKLTPTECARLQTFPDGWCENIVSNTQAYKAYGNAWTVDVIAHIFKQGIN